MGLNVSSAMNDTLCCLPNGTRIFYADIYTHTCLLCYLFSPSSTIFKGFRIPFIGTNTVTIVKYFDSAEIFKGHFSSNVSFLFISMCK